MCVGYFGYVQGGDVKFITVNSVGGLIIPTTSLLTGILLVVHILNKLLLMIIIKSFMLRSQPHTTHTYQGCFDVVLLLLLF